MKKLLVSLLGLYLFLTHSVYALNSFFLVSSIINSGDLAGGIRYAINENWVTDGFITSSPGSNNMWFDLYYKNYGIIVTTLEGSSPSYALAYSLEKNITDGIGIGASVKLVDVSKEEDATWFGGWDSYIILALK